MFPAVLCTGDLNPPLSHCHLVSSLVSCLTKELDEFSAKARSLP
jgi:hypothetical protein